MAQPSLSIFTGGKTLGTVFREQNQINVKFLEGNVPTTTTQGRASLRTNATRFVMVQGAHDGTGFTGANYEEKIADFIFEMEAWFNVSTFSYSAATYTDSFGNTYTMDLADWTWTRSFQQPTRILWSMILVEK